MTRKYTLFLLLCYVYVNFYASNDVSSSNTLIDFVERDDPSYSWEIHSVEDTGTFKYVVVKMTSQSWLQFDEVDRTEWDHWLELYIPNQLNTQVAFLYITGGNNGAEAPTLSDSIPAQIANFSGNVVAQLSQVPNQPLIFDNDGQERFEDDLIAYSWTRHLETKNPSWIAQGPMVKSAVRAMDTVSAILASEEGRQQTVEKFVVSGGSKRGWTTWLTAVVDKRVLAAVPVVFDALNLRSSMQHHFEAYGFWSPSLLDYVDHGIMPKMATKELNYLMSVVDPYEYRDRLKLPKFIINSAGDQFFLPDSSRFYWADLQGQKFLRYVPNSNHSLGGTDAVESIATFFSLIANGQDVPNITWTRNQDRSISVTATHQPIAVKVWSAVNTESRDFRLLTRRTEQNEYVPDGPMFSSYDVNTSDETAPFGYNVTIDKVGQGWKAWLVEFTFDVGLDLPLKLSTDVQITPDVLPFEGKDFTQATWITIDCPQLDEESAIPQQVVDQSKEEFKNFSHVAFNDRDYYHWNLKSELRVEGRQMADLLESLGYINCRYQLEAGPGPVLPPIDTE